MWRRMHLPPLFKTLMWKPIAFMEKSEILTIFKTLHDLASAHLQSAFPLDHSAYTVMDLFQFVQCIEFSLLTASLDATPSTWNALSLLFHLANSCSINRFWLEYSWCREDCPDLPLTPFVLNHTYKYCT